jgi:hypothetical protein
MVMQMNLYVLLRYSYWKHYISMYGLNSGSFYFDVKNRADRQGPEGEENRIEIEQHLQRQTAFERIA